MGAVSASPVARHGPAPWTDALAIGFPVAGALVRFFIASESPLPPDSLTAFIAFGALQDLAAGVVLALLARGMRRAALPAPLAAGTALVPFLILLAGHAAWAEAIVYFGHPPRREDVEVALGSSFLARSAEAQSLLRLGAFVVAGLLATLAAVRPLRARRAVPGSRLALAVAGASALSLAVRAFTPIPAANGVVFAALDLADEPRPEDAQGRATVPPPRRPVTEVRSLAPPRPPALWLSDDAPLASLPPPRAADAPRLPEGLKPNFVFVLMEGVRAREISCYGGPVPGLTPNLDRLAAEGIRFGRAYSPGTVTPQGEAAYWYGLLATPGALLPVQNPDVPLYGLPEILRGAGWRSFLWIHDGDQSFYRRDRFYLPRGFRMIDGRDFPRSDPRTNWGYSDKALARRAVDALDQTEEPFAALVLTVSNHHPFQVPADAESKSPVEGPDERGYFAFTPGAPLVGRHTRPMMRTIHYTDEAVGDFFRLAASRAWAKRTVFVVSGDHGLPIQPLGGLASSHELAEVRHGVPLIFWSPLLPGGRVITGPASLADVPPTLLGLAGLDPPRSFIGVDLLDPATDLAVRPLLLYDDEAHQVTVLKRGLAYDATVSPPRSSPSWALADGRLYDTRLDPRGTRDISAERRADSAELARDAERFLDLYPWLALTGRAGLPPSATARRP